MDDRDHLRYLAVPGNQKPNSRTIGVPWEPVRLNDGNFLRIVVNLSLDAIEDAPSKLRVYSASFQYQLDERGEQWVLRYDYVRVPENPHPASHLQIHGTLIHPECLPDNAPFDRIHLPTGRITIEAVIRLLAEQFQVPCNEEPAICRPLLAESELAFERIAHRHISGPAN
jgi:hypothetical protein